MWKVLNKKESVKYINKQPDNTIFEVTKKTNKTIRSEAQNRYYWGVVVEFICNFIWLAHRFEKYDLHKEIKEYFWLETTTGLEPWEFKQMCEEIRARYKENRDLYIPLPNEADLWELEMYLY